jgi:hypothetical protein
MAACGFGEVWRPCLCVGRKRADTVCTGAPGEREIPACVRDVHFDVRSHVSFFTLNRHGVPGG